MEDLTIHTSFKNENRHGPYAVILILLSTIIQAYYGYARDANELGKGIIALLCWGAIGVSLARIKNLLQYPKPVICIICGLLLLSFWSIVNTLVFGNIYEGNTYFVLFGNMYGALNIAGIGFLFAILTIRDVRALRKAACLMVYVSIVLLILQFRVSIESYFLTYICAFAPIFIFYSKKRDWVVLLIGILLSILCFYGGGRQAAFFLVFAFIALIAAKFLEKKWIFFISIAIIILPFISLYFSAKYGSIFDLALSSMDVGSAPQTMSDEEINADNRTFLWIEFFYDFMNRGFFTQWFGQGAVAYYESDFFRTFHRLGIEVPILQWTMQAGLTYIILFTSFVFYAIYRLYKHGNNNLCQIASILIAAYYFDCYICNTNGCSIMQLGIWFLFSIAFNEELLYLDDESLKTILSEDVNYTYDYSEEEILENEE